jgi:antitoxin MazE
MRTTVENCPAGVAVIIPAALSTRVGLRGGEPADVELTGGRLVLSPAGPETLAELLAGITPDNIHCEWAAGSPVGAELL